MSRHREIKKMSSDDYDDSGEYGRSLEEDISGLTPDTAAQYLYQRGAPTATADAQAKKGYTGRYGDAEQDDYDDDEYFYGLMDQVYDVVGDDFTDQDISKALELSGENVAEAVELLLNGVVKSTKKPAAKVAIPVKKSEPQKTQKPKQPSAKSAPSPVHTPLKKSNSLLKDSASSSASNSPASSSNSLKKTSTPVESAKSLLEQPSTPETSSMKIYPQRSLAKTKELHKEIAEAESKGKPNLSLVVCGHVDAGKSTIMGHMLVLLGNVSQRVMHRYQTDSQKIGKGSFAFAWVLDENEQERSRGVTIDIGITYFETPNKRITLLDAPGHRDFIPNMISGASQADVAILVVDSTVGEFEAGFDGNGQTKEHAILIRSLGVTNLLVAVNKMDNANWSKERFDDICGRLLVFLKQSGFKESAIMFIPCSGMTGEGLKVKKDLPWYSGPSIYDAIDALPTVARPVEKPLRMAITDFYRSMNLGTTVAGRIESGVICVGDNVIAMPSNERAIVKAIELNKTNVQWAKAGDNPEIGLSGIDAVSLGIGHVICDPENLIPVVSKIQATILTMNILQPITNGYQAVLYIQSVSEDAVVTKLITLYDKATGLPTGKKPRALTKGQSAEIELQCKRPICVEKYSDIRSLGRVTLRVQGQTVAVGVITKLIQERVDSPK